MIKYACLCALAGLWLGTSAVSAQQPPKSYNIVTDGKAKGDGVNDDTKALNQAIIKASQQGKHVYFPPGCYLITGPVMTKDGVNLLGDNTGVSIIKATVPSPEAIVGTLGKNGRSSNVVVEDLFFENAILQFTGPRASDITVRQCVFCTTATMNERCRQIVVGNNSNILIEDNFFLAEDLPWKGKKLRGISDRTKSIIIRRCIFGLDLGNLTWLSSQWKGYPQWTRPEARLMHFKKQIKLSDRVGSLGGGLVSTDSTGTTVIDNIFNLDPISSNRQRLSKSKGAQDIDHIIYAKTTKHKPHNFKFISNWTRGQPQNAAGGVKLKNSHGPCYFVANYLVDDAMLFYVTSEKQTLENQFIYRNHFKVLTPSSEFPRNSFSFSGKNKGSNNILADNIFDCPDGFTTVRLKYEVPERWKVYRSNQYISGKPVQLSGSKLLPGAPLKKLTAAYRHYKVPRLKIPAYGTDPNNPGNSAPTFTNDPVLARKAKQGSAYRDKLSKHVKDKERDKLIFSKISGPAWLEIAADGSMSGTPGANDRGMNYATVQVSDGSVSSAAMIEIDVQGK